MAQSRVSERSTVVYEGHRGTTVTAEAQTVDMFGPFMVKADGTEIQILITLEIIPYRMVFLEQQSAGLRYRQEHFRIQSP